MKSSSRSRWIIQFAAVAFVCINSVGGLQGQEIDDPNSPGCKASNFILFPTIRNRLGVFREGQRAFFCVFISPTKTGLWDPVRNTLSRIHSGDKCDVDGLVADDRYLVSTPLPPGFYSPRLHEANFGMTGKITTHFDGAGNCALTFSTYYQVRWPSEDVQGFYYIARAERPRIETREDVCGDTEGVTQRLPQAFDEPYGLVSVPLSSGFTLLAAFDEEMPGEIGVKTVPTCVAKVGENAYLVPRRVLQPVLDSVGSSVFDRYDAVLKVIEHPSIVITEQPPAPAPEK